MELIISLDDRNFEYSAKQESKIGLYKGYKKTIEKKVFHPINKTTNVCLVLDDFSKTEPPIFMKLYM